MGESIRLQKILAQAGCGSRRACEVFITDGRVTVDGIIVRQLGSKADPETQTIELDSNKIAGPGKLAKGVKASGEHVYWMLNKPKGVLCTNEDPSGRALAVQLVPEKRRVFCVGRLDKDTEGLILLTNDGELTNQLTHPKYGVEKVYVARVDGRAMPQQIAKLQRGVHLAEGKTQGARVRLRKAAGSQSILEINISEGMNRQVRRMLAAVGLYVRGLKRVSVGPVRLGEIGPGESRQLTKDELDRLRAAIRNAQEQQVAKPQAVSEDEPETDDDAQTEHEQEVRAPKKKKERAERRKPEGDEAPVKRRKTWPSEATHEELAELDEAVGTKTAMSPVGSDGSTTQEAPAVSDVAGDATQAARAINEALDGEDGDDEDAEFAGVDMEDEELAEAETAPQTPVGEGDSDDEDDSDEDDSADDDDGLIIKRKKNLNAAAALDDDEDTAEMLGLDDDDEDADDAFEGTKPAGAGEKKWVDRGDREDPRMNAAAAEKTHREEERENRKRQRTQARENAEAAGKPRGGEGRGSFKPRGDKPYAARASGGDRGSARPFDRKRSQTGDAGLNRGRGEDRPRSSGPKFSGPRRDSPAYDKRKTWGDVTSGAGADSAGDKRGGERRYEKRDGAARGGREGGRPWKGNAPRDGERKSWSVPRKDGERKPYSSGPRKDGERKPYSSGPRKEGGERKAWGGPRKDGGERKSWSGPRKEGGERKAWSGPSRDRADRGDRPARPQSREGGSWRDKKEGGAPRGDRPYGKPSGGSARPYGAGRPERSDRGGQDRRSSSSAGGSRRPDSRGGDRPRSPRPDGENRKFGARPWENKSRGGSGGGGGSGSSGPRQTRPWEKREPRSDRPKRSGGDSDE